MENCQGFIDTGNSRNGTSRCLVTLYVVLILQGKHCYLSPHPLLKTVGVSVFSDFFIIAFSDSFLFLMKKKIPWEDGGQRS